MATASRSPPPSRSARRAIPARGAERAYADLRCFSALPRGGHFAAMEEPELLADDIRALFKPLRG
jgi:microsomal epoxide hydrolase